MNDTLAFIKKLSNNSYVESYTLQFHMNELVSQSYSVCNRKHKCWRKWAIEESVIAVHGFVTIVTNAEVTASMLVAIATSVLPLRR